MNNMPWDDPPIFERPVLKVLWDYEAQCVVDAGNVSCGLFDTHWTYIHYPGARLAWVLSRCPGDCVYLQAAEVPEMVQLAVMVIE